MNDTTATPSIPLLCRLNIRHHWHYEKNPEDNHRYSRSTRCGKDNPVWATQGCQWPDRSSARGDRCLIVRRFDLVFVSRDRRRSSIRRCLRRRLVQPIQRPTTAAG